MQDPLVWHIFQEKNEIKGKYMALTFQTDTF